MEWGPIEAGDLTAEWAPMEPGMEFCLLGPLTVRSGTAVVPVPRGKQRAVLAALLLRAGQVVPLDELAEALWGISPPPSARVAIQNHVMRLRRSLADAGSRIRTQPPGYLIHVDDSELDISRFQAHAGAATPPACTPPHSKWPPRPA
jgi:DNA-binding SARP family transcriptional activator